MGNRTNVGWTRQAALVALLFAGALPAAAKPAPPPPPPPPPPPTEAPATLQRPGRMEFDERLVSGQTATSGAVYLFQRDPRQLPGLVPMRQGFRSRIVEPVLWDRPLLPIEGTAPAPAEAPPPETAPPPPPPPKTGRK